MIQEVQQENKMGILPVPKLLFQMALPVIISMLILSLIHILGYSYFGIIQALVAALQPPHLVCIMPLSYTDDYYQHGYYGGVADTYMNMYWELCPANNPVPWTTKMMSEEEMRARIKEIAKDPDIGNNTYFDKMFHVWPPKYHTFYLDYLLHPDVYKRQLFTCLFLPAHP